MRVQLAEMVEDLREKGKTHFNDLYEAKEGQRIAESKLADIERVLTRIKRTSRRSEISGLQRGPTS